MRFYPLRMIAVSSVVCLSLALSPALAQPAALDESKATAPVEYNLAELLNAGSRSHQEPLTREVLREQSDVIVNGVIQSITPGREFHKKTYQPYPIPMKTAIFEVDVLYIEKGVAGDTLYFEYVVGGIPVNLLDYVKPQRPLTLFLVDSGLNETSYRVINAEARTKGFGHHLYYLTRDDALLDQIASDRRHDISALLQEND